MIGVVERAPGEFSVTVRERPELVDEVRLALNCGGGCGGGGGCNAPVAHAGTALGPAAVQPPLVDLDVA